MFLREHIRHKDGKRHRYWSLCESVRTADGVRQRTLCYLGELNSSGQARWRKTIEVFNEQGEERQLSLFASDEPVGGDDPDVVQVRLDKIGVERARQFGACYLGWELWRKLELDRFWQQRVDVPVADVAWSRVAALLAINRLCAPSSELGITERWYPSTALDDLLGIEDGKINEDRLYRCLDKLLGEKEELEKHLKGTYGELFAAQFDVLLYDLTSTYFEGEAESNPQAKRGYSRDSRSDCKQLLIALVVSEEGFPLAYEVFDGNRADVTTLEEIVGAVENKYGRAQRVWVFDRGVVSEANLKMLRDEEGLYLVGTPRSQLKKFEKELLAEGWYPVRDSVEVKLIPHPEGKETFVLCKSSGRKTKEEAMQRRQAEKLGKALAQMSDSIAQGKRKDVDKLNRRLGRLEERYPMVSDLYQVELKRMDGKLQLQWQRREGTQNWAQLRQGAYLLRTNLGETDPAKLWDKYVQLTEAEAAFRVLKSELNIRPIWHQKQDRVQAHILVAFLGYALWVTLKHLLKAARMDLSPAHVLQQMAQIQSVDIVLETTDGREIRLRRVTRLNEQQKSIAQALNLSIPERLHFDRECSGNSAIA